MNLPEHIINKIMLYVSHPVADLFKKEMKTTLEELTEVLPGDYKYGGEDFRRGDYTSFACHFFNLVK